MTNIKITNAYNGGNQSRSMNINGNCEISNYKKGEKKPVGFMYTTIYDGNVNIDQKNGNKTSVDFSNEKYGIFLKIAQMDGKNNELSLSDLSIATKDKLGLGDAFVVKKDMNAGILNIYKKNNKNQLETYLHIDFETKAEKAKAQKPVQPQQTEIVRLKDPKGFGRDIELVHNKDGSKTYIFPPSSNCGEFHACYEYTVKNDKLIKIYDPIYGGNFRFENGKVIYEHWDGSREEYPINEEGKSKMEAILKNGSYQELIKMDDVTSSGNPPYMHW